MRFSRRTYRPWSIRWVIQRLLAVIREGRLPQIRLIDLLYDFRLTRKINSGLKRSAGSFKSRNIRPGEDIFNFNPVQEYQPFTINRHLPEESLSCVNTLFDHVFVLNLGRRLDRRIEMLQKLNKYNIRAEFFEAVDGYSAGNLEEFREYYQQPIGAEGTHPLERSLKKKMIGSPGAWGYLKTFEKLIRQAQGSRYNRILCLDDDLIFREDFEQGLRKALAFIPQDWKLLYLGATQHEWNVPYSLDYPEHLREGDFGNHPFYHPVRTDGSFAVGIDSSVYQDILDEIGRMNCAFDSGALRGIQQKYPKESYVVTPNMIIADVSQSDIGIERSQEAMARKLHWDLSAYDYPFRKELVSVIMPAYNAEKTIEKSIRSILLQNYRELEMIVGDDGSTDTTPDIVQRLSREDSRVKLVRLERNQGCYWARNAALRVSQGKYIAIQDSDDISLKTRIETQLIPLLAGRADFTLTRIFRSRCSVVEMDVNRQEEMLDLVLSRRVQSPTGLYEYRDRPIIGFMTSMFRRSLFEELGLFWENRFGSDAEFLERVLYRKAGIQLTKKDGTVHSWLSERKEVPGVYERIDKVQLISMDMTGDNITNRTSQQQKEEFEKTWRKRLKGETDYEYPVFKP